MLSSQPTCLTRNTWCVCVSERETREPVDGNVAVSPSSEVFRLRPSLLSRPPATRRQRQHRQTSPGANLPTGGCSCQHRYADFHSMCVRVRASTPSAARLTQGGTVLPNISVHPGQSSTALSPGHALPAFHEAPERGSLARTNRGLLYSKQRTNHRRNLGDFF